LDRFDLAVGDPSLPDGRRPEVDAQLVSVVPDGQTRETFRQGNDQKHGGAEHQHGHWLIARRPNDGHHDQREKVTEEPPGFLLGVFIAHRRRSRQTIVGSSFRKKSSVCGSEGQST
jgi:hypothetical protein